MAAIQTTLVIDRQNRQLVQFGASVASLPAVSQRDKIALLIKIADPATNSINGTPTILTTSEITSGKPRVTISSIATPASGDEDTYVLAKLREADFTWDADQSGFTGLLNVNTAQMEAYMVAQGGESVTVEFEVRFSLGGNLDTILAGPKNSIVIQANIDEGSDPAVDILDDVTTLNGPLQIRFANGHVYTITENVTEDGVDFNRI